MAAIAQNRSSETSLFLLIFVLLGTVIGGIGLFPTLIPCDDAPGDVGTLESPNHADIKHAGDAELAREWVSEHGRFCKWRCPDGKDRYICQMNDGKWAIVVHEQATGGEITAFITTRRSYALGIREGCKNDWHYDHP